MPRPAKDPYLKRLDGRRKWYIIDGPKRTSTGCEDEGAAKQVLADYLEIKNEPAPDALVKDLLTRRLKSLEGKARHAVVETLIPRLKKHFGALRPEQISETNVNAYLESIAATSQGHTDLEELRAALPKAHKDKVPMPARGEPRADFLTPDQQSALIEATDTYHVRLFILIALNTGARRGAILDLTWERVAPDGSWVDFRNPEMRQTKKRRGVVPCSTPLRAALNDARQLAVSPYVIEWAGQKIGRINKAFNRAAERAGLVRDGKVWCTPHVLKHTAISNLFTAGWRPHDVADFTMTTEKVVKRVYRHMSMGDLAEMAESLGGFSNSVPETPILRGAGKTRKMRENQRVAMVGAAGIEPATPTMSTSVSTVHPVDFQRIRRKARSE